MSLDEYKLLISHTISKNLGKKSIACRGFKLCIGVNLSSNSCPTIILPHPQPLPELRGGEVLALDKTGVG